jgi:DNA ligase (NAD+)
VEKPVTKRDFKKNPRAKFKPLGALTDREARAEAAALREGIEYHNDLYFVKNQPEISDSLYDKLFRRLQELEKRFPRLASKTSPTQRVGGQPRKDRQPVVHAAPMLSLHAAAGEEEVARFHALAQNNSGGQPVYYFLEPKFDGVSIELVYRDGVFEKAATRGDGHQGDDVSDNLRACRGFPRRLRRAGALPGFLSVRGEAFLTKRAFLKMNKQRVVENLEPFANPRNAVAGILHRLDTATDHLSVEVVVYEILKAERLKPAAQHEVWSQLAQWGFKNSRPVDRTNSLQGIRKYHQRLEEKRETLPFEIDGIVIKLDDLATAARLGTRHRSPRGALAWKFAPRQEITTLEDIVVQVGKSGMLTPVALLSPVDVGGVTVSRATLHNEREIRRKDIRPGDRVRIKRAGDVIPEVIERISVPRQRRGKEFHMPQKCPACGTAIVHEEANHFCPAGINCPGQLVCCLTHFASREALDIQGLGTKTARQLVEHDLVRDVSDLFRLRVKDLESLPGFAAGSAAKLHQAIQDAKRPRLDRFLYALAIRHVGQRTARLLARVFRSLRAVRETTEEEIARVAGPVVGRAVRQFFDLAANQRVLRRLEDSGMKVEDMPTPKAGQALTGKTFVFTGTLAGLTRDEAKEAVEARGGRAAASVSRKTDYVVAGANPGSKQSDAERLKIKIIEEREFRKIVGV